MPTRNLAWKRLNFVAVLFEDCYCIIYLVYWLLSAFSEWFWPEQQSQQFVVRKISDGSLELLTCVLLLVWNRFCVASLVNKLNLYYLLCLIIMLCLGGLFMDGCIRRELQYCCLPKQIRSWFYGDLFIQPKKWFRQTEILWRQYNMRTNFHH